MKNKQHQQSPGQFQQFTQQYMMYTTSQQLSPGQKKSENKININSIKTQKPKIKMVHEKQSKGSLEGLLNLSKKTKKMLTNNCKIIAIGDTIFRSNFQSGNLQSVQKIAPSTFQIRMTKQLNSQRQSAWFYFIVEGLKGQAKFIIKGFNKSSSLFNQGMKICYRQASESKWRRGGTKIQYTDSYNQSQQAKTTYELQFSYFFKSNYPNSVQFSYCFPYTYSNLIKYISLNQTKLSIQSLGRTYQGRQLPFITIGNQNSQFVIVLSARAHPGETVGSIMMEGLLKELIADNQYSNYVRQAFCFKILPMINPDGVVNGNYRFSGSGYDLNRKWRSCTTKMHPEVYLFKQKIKQLSKQKKILMFIDMHGHSRQKNVFFYGCSTKHQNNNGDGESTPNTKPKQFPYLMSKLHPAFRYDYCSYQMQKQKQGTARITMWNQLKIDYIYTLQASLCGTDITNFLVADYEKVGAKIVQGICLHFWSLIKQQISHIASAQILKSQNKINQQIKKNMNQFFQNPEIAKIQFEGNSSDSEPQAGQIPESQRERKKQKSVISIQKYYKASRIMKFSQKNIFEQDSMLINKQNIQQKLDINLRNKTNQSTRFPKSSVDTNIQSRSDIKNLSTETTLKTKNDFYIRADLLNKTINQRLRVQSQKFTEPIQSRMISQPFSLKIENQLEPKIDKNKKKSISFQGAQYRRVRKLAQEHNRRHFSAQNSGMIKEDETLIRGIVVMNNLLQLDKGKPRQRAPSFFPNSLNYSKPRKGTADMHFRKQIRAVDYTSRRLYVNGLEQEVKCLGRQII